MANELQIQIGATYILDGDIFELVEIQGPYFILMPLKVNNTYHTSDDGSIVMKAIHFSKAKRYIGM